MKGLNKVTLIGNLGSEPEVKTLESGVKVAKFSLATTDKYNDSKGNKVERTEWHNIELWEGLAGIAEKHLSKGNPVYLEGSIRTDKWTDDNRNNRSSVKIRANELIMLPSDKKAS